MYIGECHGLHTSHSVKLNVGKTGDTYQDYNYHKNQKFKSQPKCYECGTRCKGGCPSYNGWTKNKKCHGAYSYYQGKGRGCLMRDTSRTFAAEIAEGIYIAYNRDEL